jgi:maleylacetate reductase
MHVPEELVRQVHDDARVRDIDLIVAVGGGSAIGLAKAIALNEGPPFIAIPTTYSGSEMTPIWGTTRDGAKTTGRDERVRPLAVLYDPTLSKDLPLRIAVPSALNALAHCMEAFYAADANPLATLAAREGAGAIVRSLRAIAAGDFSPNIHAQLLLGAYFAGLALGMVQMGLHHKLCHVLGGSFNMPHAETHAILLPYTHAFNANAAATALQPLRELLGASTPDESSKTLHDLVQASLRAAGAPRALSELGFDARQAAPAAEIATATPYANPRAMDSASITRLLEHATEGHDVSRPSQQPS